MYNVIESSYKRLLFKKKGGIKEDKIMEMTLRWYGPGYDSVTLEQIRQIPGV